MCHVLYTSAGFSERNACSKKRCHLRRIRRTSVAELLPRVQKAIEAMYVTAACVNDAHSTYTYDSRVLSLSSRRDPRRWCIASFDLSIADRLFHFCRRVVFSGPHILAAIPPPHFVKNGLHASVNVTDECMTACAACDRHSQHLTSLASITPRRTHGQVSTCRRDTRCAIHSSAFIAIYRG